LLQCCTEKSNKCDVYSSGKIFRKTQSSGLSTAKMVYTITVRPRRAYFGKDLSINKFFSADTTLLRALFSLFTEKKHYGTLLNLLISKRVFVFTSLITRILWAMANTSIYGVIDINILIDRPKSSNTVLR
jgi:hypothetical protein